MILGTYKIVPYAIEVDGKPTTGNTIHYSNLQGEEIMIEEFYGESRPEYRLATNHGN